MTICSVLNQLSHSPVSWFSVSPVCFLCVFGSAVRSSVFAPMYSARVPHVVPVVLGLVMCTWSFLSRLFVSCLLFTGLRFMLSKLGFCCRNLLRLVLHPGPMELNLTKTFCAASFEWIARGMEENSSLSPRSRAGWSCCLIRGNADEIFIPQIIVHPSQRPKYSLSVKYFSSARAPLFTSTMNAH